MAGEDDTDFDTEIGTGEGEDTRVKTRTDDEDDLEDLSREELYDRYRAKNEEAKKYRLRLKRARGGDRTTDRDSSRRDEDDRDTRRPDRTRDDKRTRDDREDDDRDTRRSRRDDDREADRYRTELIESRAETELARAGIPADKVARAVRLIDTKSLELDGRDLIGIEDEIDDLKAEWPELFEKKRSRDDEDDDRDTRRRRIPRADVRTSGRRDSGRQAKTATEIQAERLATYGRQ